MRFAHRELFDPLGLIRTEELLRADQYYGVDAQYFTTVIDYGFSKRLEEALVKWGRENVLRDVVRVVDSAAASDHHVAMITSPCVLLQSKKGPRPGTSDRRAR